MYNRHALIVDDSKTAQLRLRRMLERYELQIDMVGSAEEALAYLSYAVPAVIFLDQSMKGMDGIEALRTIKANPSTATIPVIMYTSEKGNMFTSQAWALGALDILNKSTLAPSSLEKVLSTLKIRERSKSSNTLPALEGKTELLPAPIEQPAAQEVSPLSRTDLEDIRLQIARLFEIHIADVTRQLSKSTQFLAKRLTAAAEVAPKAPAEIVVGDLPLSVINEEVSAERRRIGLVSNSLLALLLVGLLGLGGLLFNLFDRLDALSNGFTEVATMTEMSAVQTGQLAEEFQRASNPDVRASNVGSSTLSLLTWMANTNFSFGANEEPLGEAMITKLQQLLFQLSDMGYEGVVEINLHFGNTCLSRTMTGEWVMAPDTMPAYECIFRASLREEFRNEDYMGLPYLSFEKMSPLLQDGAIALGVNTLGLSNPRVAYPSVSGATTAGEWNRAALQNNFISFTFLPFE